MTSAPALAKSSRYRSGSAIIRWTSSGRRVAARMALTTGGPIVMFGTKQPSITSTWIQSAPALSTARTSSASRPKSAERIEGAMVIGGGVPVGADPLEMTCVTNPRGGGRSARRQAGRLRIAPLREWPKAVTVAPASMNVRRISKGDFDRIVEVIDHWWGGPIGTFAHPIFYYELGQHALVVEQGSEMIGFLLGFPVPGPEGREGDARRTGYVHLVGIHPDYRRRGVGRLLYDRFTEECRTTRRVRMKAS